MAKRLASVRTGDDEPSPKATREALRDVIGRCLYGVDVNPMAAELCRVSLWMEALVPGRPLSFLDHHIQVGNSLLGTTSDLISGGIPDDAFKRIEGDDNKLTSDYRKRNREERKAWEAGQLSFSLRNLDRNRETIERGYEEIEEGEESSVAAVREKAAQYADLQDSEEMFHARRLADAWCAAFVWPKKEGGPEAISQQIFAELTLNPYAVPRETEEEIERIAGWYSFFHWHLAFPNVFGGGRGFDVVLGNAPWERVNLKKQEWFAARRPEIASAANADARQRLIDQLTEDDPALHEAYMHDLRKADGEGHLIRNSGRFPLCGQGDINTYSVFAETDVMIVSATGRIGCILPSGIATDNTTRGFFSNLMVTRTLVSLYDFENRKKIFSTVDSRMKFCLLTIAGRERPVKAADFAFFALAITDLSYPERRFELSAEDIALLNPNTHTCPIFRTRRDAEITKSIYHRVPVLFNGKEKDRDLWNATLRRMLHMSDDSGLFRTWDKLEADSWERHGNVFHRGNKCYLSLYEAKMLHHYDHRWATYSDSGDIRDLTTAEKMDPHVVATPRYWVPEAEVQERLTNHWRYDWLLVFRRVARTTDERSAIFSVLPKSGIGDSVFLLMPQASEPSEVVALLANLNSLPYDFTVRRKVGGMNFNFYIVEQLPIFPPDIYNGRALWDENTLLREWLASRVLELTYTAWDLEPFARDLGYEGPPFRWDPERRFLLRCELDAAFFHLYGIGRDDADYIMETFPIVKRKDEAAHGEYRTKRVMLEIYDQMASAAETGQPYQTLLDPPPAELDLAVSDPATVTSLHPREERPYLRPEEAQPASVAAEEKAPYDAGVKEDATNPTPDEPQHLTDTTLELKDSSQRSPKHRAGANEPASDQSSDTPPDATLFPDNEVETKNTIPSIEEAALALHACVPDGEKVQREKLLLDAARELGHTKLTTKVRRSLNKALNVEHNKKRLRTDWKVVWKPKRK